MKKANQISTFDLEKELLKNGYDFVIGIDEAGRGPLAGPVVASAVCLKTFRVPLGHEMSKELALIRDSKMLSEKQRENIFDFIHENFHVGVGLCDHETIDRINILEASFLAMKKAVGDLQKNLSKTSPLVPLLGEERENNDFRASRKIILVDGNKVIPNFSMEQKAIVGGDKIIKSISAASIVAKVTRDRMMLEFDAKHPQYGFAKHKGYGTKTHVDAINKYGPCKIHRQSFEPVKTLAKRSV